MRDALDPNVTTPAESEPPTLPTGKRPFDREAYASYARSFAGLVADSAPGEPRTAYLRLIAPGESPEFAADMARMSGCAFVVAGLWRSVIRHPLLDAPYVIGSAVTRLLKIAGEAGAVQDPERVPQLGDVLIVGMGREEHVWTVVGGDGVTVDGIDGGQVVGGYQAITLRRHALQGGFDVTATYRREVMVVIDVAAVVREFGV